MANHYGRPVIGWADDVARLGRREVDAFFKRHYGPQSLTVTIVGDVDPAQARTCFLNSGQKLVLSVITGRRFAVNEKQSSP